MSSPAVLKDPTTRSTIQDGRRSTRTVGFRNSAGDRSSLLEVIALLAIAGLLILGALSANGRHGAELPLLQLEVQAGDSLWKLAAAHPVEGLSTAEVTDLLADANHLEGALIVPGQRILVPAGLPEKRLVAR